MRLRRKVCLLGARGVGKTGLVRRFVEQRFEDFALAKAQLDAAGKLEWRIVHASAKSGDDVQEAFARLAETMLEARKASA